MPPMSLKAKIALGVIAATAILAVALAVLGLQAKDELDKADARRKERTQAALETLRTESQQQYEKFNEEQHRLAIRSIERLVIAQLDPILATPRTEVGWVLRDLNGMDETGIVELQSNGGLTLKPEKPEGSKAGLTAEEQVVAQRVFEAGRHEFLGDVLFYPYNPPPSSTKLQYLLRLKLDIPPVAKPQSVQIPPLEEPQAADLGGVIAAAFTTLALAMLAVFVLLMFALRKFVLAPLGNVLEDSERIVKGTEGLTVQGFKGGKGKDIETLVAAFNAMFSELKAYQSDLEGKVKDATRTIKAQQQSLVIAQRLAATGTLAAGLAHEVNNPLSGMLNAARRLKKKDGLDERARDYIELIEEGLTRIENLMKQILDFSRRRDMKPERFSAEDAFRRALPLVRHRLEKKNLRLEEDIRKDLPDIYGNAEEIGQVLMNLLINAADASPEEGAVRVTIAPTAAGGVSFAVEDSGDGVPMDIRERIFDPFFTTKEPGKGTGLGLAIAHTIVDNHGGSLRVEQGATLHGARFVMELPKAELHESRRIKEVV
jgi:signal transduction histidine kinase